MQWITFLLEFCNLFAFFLSIYVLGILKLLIFSSSLINEDIVLFFVVHLALPLFTMIYHNEIPYFELQEDVPETKNRTMVCTTFFFRKTFFYSNFDFLSHVSREKFVEAIRGKERQEATPSIDLLKVQGSFFEIRSRYLKVHSSTSAMGHNQGSLRLSRRIPNTSRSSIGYPEFVIASTVSSSNIIPVLSLLK